MTRRLAGVLMAGALLAAMLPGTAAAADPNRPLAAAPDWLQGTRIQDRSTVTGDELKTLAPISAKGGRVDVMVRLSARPVVESLKAGKAAQSHARAAVRSQQSRVLAAAKAADAKVKVLGSTRNASNILALNLSPAAVRTLARNRDVVSIKPVKNYTADLSETVPYIGAKAVQQTGVKGKGVKVAVLDSGIDYTHKGLGGDGTKDAYDAAYGVSTDDVLNTEAPSWPQGHVYGGYDFVGESWPFGDLAPDPDPIDSPSSSSDLGFEYGTDGGHGTHVADIIGGVKGVAPAVKLYGVKVCSSVSTSCSGVALIQGMDWAMDPNGDGDLSDHVDLINMSLGSDFGTVFDDDLSNAVDRATFYADILTVAASGNGGNQPYVSGTPAGAASALAVAQTQVPSAVKYFLRVIAPDAIAGIYKNTETLDWAPITDGFTGDVVYVGRGCPVGDVAVADPYLADPNGKIALIDRGACNISAKVDRAADAGATAVLIGLVAPGDAVSFSLGDGDNFVQSMVIQQSLSTAIKTALGTGAVTVSVSAADSIGLVGGMVGSSSRGPNADNMIKPEIGAPGASESAVSGSFTGTEAFGGTSGATPMITGSAALLLSKYPTRSALEIKALLMNNAESTVYWDKAAYGKVLAPVTRIGGGEVRVNRSAAAPFAVYDQGAKGSALSFGQIDVWKNITKTRTLTVRNYSKKPLTLALSSTFRYANDQANGAVKLSYPPVIVVPANGTKTVKVTLSIDASKLRDWSMEGGELGADPTALDLLEYDGYLKFNRVGYRWDDKDPVHVPWQVLPRKSAMVNVATAPALGGSTSGIKPAAVVDVVSATLANTGAGVAALDSYSLVGTSARIGRGSRGGNAPVVDLKALGVRTTEGLGTGSGCEIIYQVALSTYDRQTTSIVPSEFDIYFDTNGDEVPDYITWTQPMSTSPMNGRSISVFGGLNPDGSLAYAYYNFWTDFGQNDTNTIVTLCAEDLGLNPATAIGTPMNIYATAWDWYYTGSQTDEIDAAVIFGGERYVGMVDDIAPASSEEINIQDWGTVGTSPDETGIMLVTNAWRGDWRGGATPGHDQLILKNLPVAP